MHGIPILAENFPATLYIHTANVTSNNTAGFLVSGRDLRKYLSKNSRHAGYAFKRFLLLFSFLSKRLSENSPFTRIIVIITVTTRLEENDDDEDAPLWIGNKDIGPQRRFTFSGHFSFLVSRVFFNFFFFFYEHKLS